MITDNEYFFFYYKDGSGLPFKHIGTCVGLKEVAGWMMKSEKEAYRLITRCGDSRLPVCRIDGEDIYVKTAKLSYVSLTDDVQA